MIASRLSLHSLFFPLEEKKVEIHAIHAKQAIHALYVVAPKGPAWHALWTNKAMLTLSTMLEGLQSD
jgi:hypothetical protein